MIIIEPGNVPDPNVKQLQCNNCKCVFQIDKYEEGTRVSDRWKQITCPEYGCGNTLSFEVRE